MCIYIYIYIYNAYRNNNCDSTASRWVIGLYACVYKLCMCICVVIVCMCFIKDNMLYLIGRYKYNVGHKA